MALARLVRVFGSGLPAAWPGVRRPRSPSAHPSTHAARRRTRSRGEARCSDSSWPTRVRRVQRGGGPAWRGLRRDCARRAACRVGAVGHSRRAHAGAARASALTRPAPAPRASRTRLRSQAGGSDQAHAAGQGGGRGGARGQAGPAREHPGRDQQRALVVNNQLVVLVDLLCKPMACHSASQQQVAGSSSGVTQRAPSRSVGQRLAVRGPAGAAS